MLYTERIVEEKDKNGIRYFLKMRTFLGKLTDFDSKEEAAFEKKHLKAYLRGELQFTFGSRYNSVTKKREVNWYTVQEAIKLLPISEEEAKKYKVRDNDNTNTNTEYIQDSINSTESDTTSDRERNRSIIITT